MAGRMPYVQPNPYEQTVRMTVREDLDEKPLTPRQVALFLVGLAVVVVGVVLWLATGEVPA